MALGDDPLGTYANAISRIESGGRYDLLGPVTRTGDRAYGRYQVMGANIPTWTEAAGLGRMTPQQFLASPQAQDAVFRHRFGQYVDRYGPTGAAGAWFAGERGMRNPNAQDQLGTTVAEYMRRFTEGVGGAPAASEAAPAQQPGGNPWQAAVTPEPSQGGLAGLFGSLSVAPTETRQQPQQDPATAAARMAESLTPDAELQVSAAPMPRLDLTRLRALLQGRGRLGTA
jgi:hypothetical protein